MAITLTITDGTDTVSFNDGTTLSLSDSFQMNVGTGGSVTELVIAGWHITGANTKATTVRKYNHLIRKAVRHYRERLVDKAVWLTWKPDDQTGTQYAKVQGGTIIEVDTYTIGGREGGIFAPEIIREAEWRSQPPNGTAGASLYTATAVVNKKDADGDNWIDHVARSTEAPGLLEFTIDPAQSFGELVISRRLFASAAAGDNFNPWFNADDQSTAQTESADTAAPADVKITFNSNIAPAGGAYNVEWTLTAAQVPFYAGRFLAYCWVKQTSGTGTVRARLVVKNTGIRTPARTISSSRGKIFLGNLNLPGVSTNPFRTSNDTLVLQLQIEFADPPTDIVDIYALWLVPIEFGLYNVKASGAGVLAANNLVVDSINDLAYLVDGSGNIIYGNVIFTPSGTYPVQEGNVLNRFYFFFSTSDEHNFNDSFAVDGRIVDRWYALRGNQ